MITLDLTPIEEARITTVARQTGLAPAEYVKKLVTEHLPPVETVPAALPISEKNAAAIALLESWLAAAPTDPVPPSPSRTATPVATVLMGRKAGRKRR